MNPELIQIVTVLLKSDDHFSGSKVKNDRVYTVRESITKPNMYYMVGD